MLQAATLANAMLAKTQRNDLLDAATQKLQQAASGSLSKGEAKKVASDFETLFISQMMEHMFSGDSLGESLFGNAETDEIYQSMMVDQYAKKIVEGGGIGIAAYIERALADRALLKTQEVQS